MIQLEEFKYIMKINQRQIKFTYLYHKTGNASKSYIEAGYKVRDLEIAAQKASRLLATNGKVRKLLSSLEQDTLSRHRVTIEKLVLENARLAFQDLNQVLKIEDGELKLKSDEIDINMLNGAYESKPEDNSRNREANADSILRSLRKFTS